MTLNITLVTPLYVIQVSDRRMVSIPGGKPFDDEANKGIILKTDDGLFSIVFAGLGLYGKQRIDIWLAEQMINEGVPELPIIQGLEIVARVANDLFARIPNAIDKRHTFTVAGWQNTDQGLTPCVWRITNCITRDDISLTAAADSFEVQRLPMSRSDAHMFVTGLCGAITRPDKRRIYSTLRAHLHPDRVEQALVDVVKRASSDPNWGWGINASVMAITMTVNGESRATHYPPSDRCSRYLPLVVWYEAGRNYAAGNGWIQCVDERQHHFGPIVVTVPATNPAISRETRAEFSFQFSDAKYKKEPIGNVTFWKAFAVASPGPETNVKPPPPTLTDPHAPT